MKRRGFTLVELLAVIAILAILVIIALPNVMNLFNSAKENSFVTEIKKIYRGAEQAYVQDSFNNSGTKVYSKCSDGCTNELDMSVRDDLDYYIEINGEGKVVKYYVKDNSYQFSYEGEMDINSIFKVDNLGKIDKKDVLIINSLGGSKTGWKPPEGKFRVIHSSDGSIETFDVQDNFNIYALTKDNYLYGGYFKNYLSKGDMDDEGNYPNFTVFRGTEEEVWKYEDGYAEDGRSMTPVSQATYFLREVPSTYLYSYLHYTGWGIGGSDPTIGAFFHVSHISDCAYNETGIFMNGDKKPSSIYNSLTITAGSSTVKLTVDKIWGSSRKGYLLYGKFDNTDYMIDQSTYIGTPYYITKDNILVKAKKSRTIFFGNGNHLNDMVISTVSTSEIDSE